MNKFTLLGIMRPPGLARDDYNAFAGKLAEFVLFKQKYSLLPRIPKLLELEVNVSSEEARGIVFSVDIPLIDRNETGSFGTIEIQPAV